MALNRCEFIGNLGKAPEVRMTPTGKKVATFSLAVTEKFKNKQTGETQESTEWISVVAWDNSTGNGLASVAERFFQKGTKLFVSGKWKTRSWDDPSGGKRYKTELLLETFEFAGGSPAASGGGYGQSEGGSSGGYGQGSGSYGSQPDGMNPDGSPMMDDDLPF